MRALAHALLLPMTRHSSAQKQSPRRSLDSSVAAAMRLAAGFRALDLFERLAAVRDAVTGRLVFTTSFGLEDQAITHAIFTQDLSAQDLAIDVVTLDTGRLFPETHQVWAETERR